MAGWCSRGQQWVPEPLIPVAGAISWLVMLYASARLMENGLEVNRCVKVRFKIKINL